MVPSMAREPRMHRMLALTLAVSLTVLATGGCSSLSFKRNTETSGTFKATGWSVTFFSYDFPERAIDIARENASDANLPHMKVLTARVWPHLGPLDFLIELIGFRYARISGTWGFDGEQARSSDANR
jgi:hypothetical protein